MNKKGSQYFIHSSTFRKNEKNKGSNVCMLIYTYTFLHKVLKFGEM